MSNYLSHQAISLKKYITLKENSKDDKICFKYLGEESKTNLSQNYQESCVTCQATNMLCLNF